jgi:hypothetical protein
MLTRRTNILFDETQWAILAAESKAQKTSIGELVRHAVADTYGHKDLIARRKAIFDRIIKIRPAAVRGTIDYKELINYGRKV